MNLGSSLLPGSTRATSRLLASSISVASSSVTFEHETSTRLRRMAVFTNAVAITIAWGRVLRNASAMIAERESLRMGIEQLTVLFLTEVSSFDFQVECTDGTVQYKLNAQSLRLFGLHRDVKTRIAPVRIVSKKQHPPQTVEN